MYEESKKETHILLRSLFHFILKFTILGLLLENTKLACEYEAGLFFRTNLRFGFLWNRTAM